MIHFITPYSAEGIDSVDALTNALSGQAAEPSGEPEPEVQVEQPEQAPTDDVQDPQPEPAPPVDKQAQANYAWAEMRNENKQLRELLGKMAQANGIQYKDGKDLVRQLNDHALEGMAQRQNVPVELLREVEQLRQDSASWKRYQQEQAAASGFQAIQTQYGLTQEQLNQFAVELANAGKNPFENSVDVVAEYKARHFDEILQAGIQKGIEAALRRDQAANDNSSSPSQMQGTAGNASPSKVDSVAALTALLGG